jgi:transposase
VRFIGMDVHRDFCEIAIAHDGAIRAAGRIATEPQALELFARSLVDSDEVVLEATANALAIARIIEPHVRRVVLAKPKAVRENSRRAKTDKIDAELLAQLLAVGFLDQVWTPDEAARTCRRVISRRCQLVHQRTREKNQVHATPQRNLLTRPPVSDLFGVKGRAWLAESGKIRTVPMARQVAQGLADLDRARRAHAQAAGIPAALRVADPVIGTALGDTVDASALTKRYKKACQAIGLRAVRWHGLRHSFVTAAREGFGADRVQQMAGHGDGRTAQRYAHARSAADDATSLSDILDAASHTSAS